MSIEEVSRVVTTEWTCDQCSEVATTTTDNPPPGWANVSLTFGNGEALSGQFSSKACLRDAIASQMSDTI